MAASTGLQEQQSALLRAVDQLLSRGDEQSLTGFLNLVPVPEIASLLESLPPAGRQRVFNAVSTERQGEVLAQTSDNVRAELIDDMHPEELVAAAGAMEVDDLVEVFDDIPKAVGETILENLQDDIRERLETTLTFDEDTAGRLMRSDAVNVRADVRLDVVLRYLRRRQLPTHTDALMVIDREGHFMGTLPLAAIVTNEEEKTVRDVMYTQVATVLVSTPSKDVASLFERRDLISLPVVDADNRLLGRVTIDEVLDIVRGEADRALLQRAGLRPDEDLFAPVLPSASRRALWLGINLVTAFLAAAVIGLFEEALKQIVALAVLMPIVASMGGIAGSQTLTLTIRGLALNQIASANLRWLTRKELLIGALNGLAWAIVVGVAAYFWFDDVGVGIIIGIAIVLNLLAAAISGIFIPLILNRMGIDPALSGAVILTTVTDVVGFFSFLGLATLFLLR